MLRLTHAVTVCVLAIFPAAASAATYYVSAAGDDVNSGTHNAPWRTLARANAAVLRPGDVLLLRGGDTFSGGLSFDGGTAGTAVSAVSITSYGSGRATIAPSAGSGLLVHNAAGFRISHLRITGAGDDSSGVRFFNDLSGDVVLASIAIDDVEVSGFGRDGIEVGSWNGASGYRDVRITRASVHGNARTGVLFYAQQPNVHQDVYVGDSRAYANSGIASSVGNSGSGIVLGAVNRGVVERSVAFGNGWLCTASEGPVGIWAYDSTAITLQHNESHGNRTGGSADGGGFDLDQNVSNSVVQFNYSHDNAGAGYLLAQGPATDRHHSNVVRFNISENDGRRNQYAGIELWGRIRSAEIYNNTVFVTASASSAPRAVHVSNTGVPGSTPASVHFRNNILQTSGGAPLVDVAAGVLGGTPDIRFEGNAYFTGGGAFKVAWGSASYSTLSSWRTTSQEVLAGGPVGVSLDPRLNAAGSGGTADDATRLELVRAYELRPDSPVAAMGLDLQALFGISDGGVDFFGTRLATRAARPIGASQSSAAPAAEDVVRHARDAAVVAGAWRVVADSTAADGVKLSNPNAGAATLASASPAPSTYFDMTIEVEAGRPYRLWMRGAASGNSWTNDSVFVQFSGSVDSLGAAKWRTGTTSAAAITLEDCTGCGVLGWGWQDNASGVAVAGPFIYFAASGPQTMRVQPREDGLSIDQIVLSPRTFLLRAPGAVRDDSTVVPGTVSTPPVTTATDVVIYAADVPSSSIAGRWSRVADSSAAAGVTLWNANQGAAKLTQALAAPASYFDASFEAQANVAYHVWLRLRAEGNAAGNDSVYVQYSGSVDAAGHPIRRIGTTDADAVILQDGSGAPIAGWGWNDNGWGSVGTAVQFAVSGPQTIRVQQREDGAFVDQIVLSPARYLTASPGSLTNDHTIVAR